MKVLSIKSFILACLLVFSTIEAEVPFDFSRGLVEVEVRLNDRIRGRFGIDTGADKLYLNRAFVEAHDLEYAENTRRRESTGVTGKSQQAFVDLASIEIDGHRFEGLRSTVVDLGSLSGTNDREVPDGLIGHEILRDFFLTVDYSTKTMSLDIHRPRSLSGNRHARYSFHQYRHLMLVDVVLNGGHTAPMILDLCASHTLISPELAGTLGLDPVSGSRHFVSSMALAGAHNGRDITLDRVPVAVTDLTHYRRSAPRAEFEGVIGGTFLGHLKITIDYKSSQIFVHER